MLFTFYVDPSFQFTLWPPLWLQLCSASIHLTPNIFYAPTHLFTSNVPNILCNIKFNTMFKRECHWSHSWATWIRSIPPPMPLISILILPFNLCLQIQVVSFFQVHQPKSINTCTVIWKYITLTKLAVRRTRQSISFPCTVITLTLLWTKKFVLITCKQLIVKAGTEGLAGTWMTIIFSRVWHVTLLMEGTQYEIFALWYIHPQ